MINFDPTRQIALIWSIEDVISVRPDLSDIQAFMVLRYVKNNHDCTIGVTWDTLRSTAEILYPK